MAAGVSGTAEGIALIVADGRTGKLAIGANFSRCMQRKAGDYRNAH